MALGTLGLLVIGGIPTTIGVCEAISAQKKQNAAHKETAKFHLTAMLPLPGLPPAEAMVVLRDGRPRRGNAAKEFSHHDDGTGPATTLGENEKDDDVAMDQGQVAHTRPPVEEKMRRKQSGLTEKGNTEKQLWVDHQARPVDGHKFTGYYFTYPSEEQHRGLVSTIADDPPMLNWIFGDKESGAMRYAGKKDTIGHRIGPWGWSDDDTWLTLDGDPDCFMAEEDPETKNWSVVIVTKNGKDDLGGGRGRGDGGVQKTLGGDESGDDGESDYEDDASVEDYELQGDEEEDEEEEGGPRRLRIRLRRRMVLGMDSKYVKS